MATNHDLIASESRQVYIYIYIYNSLAVTPWVWFCAILGFCTLAELAKCQRFLVLFLGLSLLYFWCFCSRTPFFSWSSLSRSFSIQVSLSLSVVLRPALPQKKHEKGNTYKPTTTTNHQPPPTNHPASLTFTSRSRLRNIEPKSDLHLQV